jgi:hypothetical protein
MSHITGPDRSQALLLPESLDEYVGPENPVRFIDAFVDGLDLIAAGFNRVAAKVTGRPGYSPKDLLKLYVYGYLNRVRSSRRLEAERLFALVKSAPMTARRARVTAPAGPWATLRHMWKPSALASAAERA